VSTARPGTEQPGTEQSSSEQRRAALRAEMEARVQQQRQQPLPAWLAARGNRRALALVPAATFTVGVVAAAVDGETLGVLVMTVAAALGVGGILLLRRTTRMLDSAPDRLLDEREISERDRAYRRGFHLTLALLGVLMVLAVVDAFLTKTSTVRLFGGDGWIHLVLASFFTVSMLPAAALAWHWQAPADDLDD